MQSVAVLFYLFEINFPLSYLNIRLFSSDVFHMLVLVFHMPFFSSSYLHSPLSAVIFGH